MPWPKIGAPQYHAELGLPDKGRAIKLGFCYDRDLERLDLLNGLALGLLPTAPTSTTRFLKGRKKGKVSMEKK